MSLSGFAHQVWRHLESRSFFQGLNALTSVKPNTNALEAAAKEADERRRLG